MREGRFSEGLEQCLRQRAWASGSVSDGEQPLFWVKSLRKKFSCLEGKMTTKNRKDDDWIFAWLAEPVDDWQLKTAENETTDTDRKL